MLETIKELLNDVFIQVILTVVLPILSYGVIKLINSAFGYLEKQKIIKDSELMKSTMQAVEALLIEDVRFANDNFSKGVKKDMEDGTITKEEGLSRLKKYGTDIIQGLKDHKPEYFEILGVDRIVKKMENLYEDLKG